MLSRVPLYHGVRVFMKKVAFRPAFTIVELIVVIAIIGILVGVTLVSYGAWRSATATNSVKNDLSQAAATMESSRTFDGAYPLTLPGSFEASDSNTILLTLPDTASYCIDGTSSISDTIEYYIDNLTRPNGATAGTCATRTSLPIPSSVANVAFTTGSSQINVSWTLPSPNYATQYLVQCALDPAFITGLVQNTVSNPTATGTTLTGATAVTSYYCRVKSTNANGQSSWSNLSNGDTQQYVCADTNQYGTYPDCYAYDSIAVGASIAGYWTTPPSQYLLEDGSAVSRTTYADLFAVIGTTFGAGNGTTTFNLPDSRGRATVNINSSDTEFDTIGETYGEKSHTLLTTEIPAHSHVQNVTANSGGPAVRNDYSNEGSSAAYPQGVNTNTAGSGSPSNVTQPSIVKQYAIKWRPSTGTNSTLPPGTTLQGYWTSASPSGYTYESGTPISRTTYSVLFGAIGTTYGAGDGSTTFSTPNSRGRVGVNRNASDTQFATLGLTFGEKTHLLSIAEMASHSHTQVITANSGGSAVRNDYSADASGLVYTQTLSTAGAGGGQAFNVIQPSIVKRSSIKTTAAIGTVDDSGIAPGTSIEGWWATIPTGFLAEDGSAVSRTTYANLFAVIGTTHGAGDGSTTFNLPDSRGRVSVNRNSGDSLFGTIGQKSGEKTHIMTLAELPSHSHAQYVTAANGGNAWRNDYKADAAGGGYAQGISTGTTGSSTAYNVIQPSITKMFAIKY